MTLLDTRAPVTNAQLASAAPSRQGRLTRFDDDALSFRLANASLAEGARLLVASGVASAEGDSHRSARERDYALDQAAYVVRELSALLAKHGRTVDGAQRSQRSRDKARAKLREQYAEDVAARVCVKPGCASPASRDAVLCVGHIKQRRHKLRTQKSEVDE